MKIQTPKTSPVPTPLTIILETPEEVETFFHLLNYGGDYDRGHYLTDDRFPLSYEKFRKIKYQMWKTFDETFPQYYNFLKQQANEPFWHKGHHP